MASKRTGLTIVTIPAPKARAVTTTNVKLDVDIEKDFWFGLERVMLFILKRFYVK